MFLTKLSSRELYAHLGNKRWNSPPGAEILVLILSLESGLTRTPPLFSSLSVSFVALLMSESQWVLFLFLFFCGHFYPLSSCFQFFFSVVFTHQLTCITSSYEIYISLMNFNFGIYGDLSHCSSGSRNTFNSLTTFWAIRNIWVVYLCCYLLLFNKVGFSQFKGQFLSLEFVLFIFF